MSIGESLLAANVRTVLALIARALPHSTSTPEYPLPKPIIIGLSGLQGSGKSTWAAAIVPVLEQDYGLRAITVSLDDFYKTHDALLELRKRSPENKLFRTRGQPGTHDEQLAKSFFAQATCESNNTDLKIPSFDKSCFNGEGDRAPECTWPVVQLPVDVIVFEGWCVGFQAILETSLRVRHDEAVSKRKEERGISRQVHLMETLADHRLEHLVQLNESLREYNETFMGVRNFDAVIHLDTDDLANVYDWRIDQERALRKRTGKGMTDEAVVEFVRGYVPAYELYLDGLRRGLFSEILGEKLQVRVCLDVDRRVIDTRML